MTITSGKIVGLLVKAIGSAAFKAAGLNDNTIMTIVNACARKVRYKFGKGIRFRIEIDH